MAKKSAEEVPLVDNRGKVKVTLLKNHTHAGKDYKAGETIEVREDQEKWLEAAGVVGKKEE